MNSSFHPFGWSARIIIVVMLAAVGCLAGTAVAALPLEAVRQYFLKQEPQRVAEARLLREAPREFTARFQKFLPACCEELTMDDQELANNLHNGHAAIAEQFCRLLDGQPPRELDALEAALQDDHLPRSDRGLAALLLYLARGRCKDALAAVVNDPSLLALFAAVPDKEFEQTLAKLLSSSASFDFGELSRTASSAVK